MLKRTILPLLASLVLIWAIGCSDNPLQADGDTPSLSEEFGGYTATAEAPGFGDTELIETEREEEVVDDPILTSPPMQELINNVEAGMFHFRAVWGRIPGDVTVTEETDWTGSLTVTRGGLVVRRLIRFELNQDYYLPRTQRELVEWISITTIYNDGIAVDILVPPLPLVVDTTYIIDGTDTTLVIDTLAADPVTLTFETGPYTRTFTLDELATLDEVVTLDDGNKVAFHGLQMFRQACPRGILTGHWGYDEEGNGVYRGLWFSNLGYLGGYLRGHYGTDEQGNNVFYGKWIDRAGNFKGFLKGTWGYQPWVTNDDIARRRPGGWFAGRIFDSGRNAIGGLSGRYGAASHVRGGWFQGRWKLTCDELTETGNGNDIMDDGIL